MQNNKNWILIINGHIWAKWAYLLFCCKTRISNEMANGFRFFFGHAEEAGWWSWLIYSSAGSPSPRSAFFNCCLAPRVSPNSVHHLSLKWTEGTEEFVHWRVKKGVAKYSVPKWWTHWFLMPISDATSVSAFTVHVTGVHV